MKSIRRVRPLPKPLNNQASFLGYMLLLDIGIMNVCVIVAAIYEMFRQLAPYFKNKEVPTAVLERLTNDVMSSGTSSIVAVLLGVAVLAIFFRRSQPIAELWGRVRKMTPARFIPIFVVFMSAQFLSDRYYEILVWGTEAIGLQGMEDFGSLLQGTELTVSMVLYVGIVAPIAEEIIYRGFVLKSLTRFGKWFAIVVSSILFGLVHGNIIQTPFAFLVGLVLGYVAIEYSIWWSIVLHMINNLFFAELWSWVISQMPTNVQEPIYHIVNTLFFIAAVVIIALNRKKIIHYCRKTRGNAKMYRQVFLTSGIILFVLFCLVECALVLVGTLYI